MNRSKIDWCDYTWNPVTGCKHGCEYCYAKKITERFMPHNLELLNLADCKPTLPISEKNLGCYECDSPVVLTNFKGEKIRTTPYPHGFKPTFHKYRLDEPFKKKPFKSFVYKSKSITLEKYERYNIFVSSMGDLFGEWVPDEWIEEVFKACKKADWHNYLFLTKNPKRLISYWYEMALPGSHYDISPNYENKMAPNMWAGITVTNNKQLEECNDYIEEIFGNKFISFEPLLEELKTNDADIFYYANWVIIGAMTGAGSKKYQPKKEWIQSIVDQCKEFNIPIFMKNNLSESWGEKLIRQYPEGLK